MREGEGEEGERRERGRREKRGGRERLPKCRNPAKHAAKNMQSGREGGQTLAGEGNPIKRLGSL